MLQAVIFDFDGIIADTEPLHLAAFNRVLGRYGVEISSTTYYEEYLGFNDHDCFEIIKKAHPLKLGKASIKSLMQQKAKTYLEIVKDESCVIEHVPEFLRMLADNNILLAICSGGLRNEIETVLLQARLNNFFEVIVSADEIKKGKPDPQGFILTLEMLNSRHPGKIIKPQDCVVIEDSHWGIEAAHGAKMHIVAVTNSYEAEELAKAELVVDNLGELAIADLQKICK